MDVGAWYVRFRSHEARGSTASSKPFEEQALAYLLIRDTRLFGNRASEDAHPYRTG